MTVITINEDQTLSVAWKGKKDKGSLFQLSASGLVTQVNALGFIELMAVHSSAKVAPFPLGAGEHIYRFVLDAVTKEALDTSKVDLGEFRKEILARASQGVNAPYDSYLQIAYDIKTGNNPVHHY